MKKIALLLAFLACFAATAFGQSNPPLRVTEPDGVPNVSGVTTLKFSNGSVTCSGKVCTVVTGGGGGGTVTSISVVSANGLAGTVATATTTPAITLTTTITGILSGNGTAISAASTTGSSAVVLATSPTLVTPVLGVASATSLALTGTAGAGFLEIANQSSKPATPTTAGRLYWDNSNRLSWIGTNGFIRTFDGTANLADRVYTLQDSTGTIAMLEAAESFSGQQTFANGVTTGTGTSSGTVFAYNSLTTGAGANFSSSSVTTGNIVNIASTSTAATSNTLTGLNIAISGANASTAQTVRGAVISVTNTNATSGTNAALTLMASGATTANTALNVTVGAIVQASTSATAFVSGASSATPSFQIDNSTASQASGIKVTGSADGTAPIILSISRTQTASALAGNGLAITADPAIAGSSNAGAAAGGAITLTSGAAARLTSGNANGGNIVLATGAGIGTGTQGQILMNDGASLTVPAIAFSAAANTGIYRDSAAQLSFTTAGSNSFAVTGSGVKVAGSNGLTFGTAVTVGADTFVGRLSAAFLRFGQADAAAPVAQTLGVQNVATGTSNTAGVDWTEKASAGTGTGAGGKKIFQVAPASSTGTAQNSFVTAFTIDSNVHLITGGTAPTVGGSCGTSPSIVGTDHAGKVTTGTVAPTSCTVTFNKTWTNAPACIAVNETTSNLLKATSTTTTLILAGTMVASDSLAYVCSGY